MPSDLMRLLKSAKEKYASEGFHILGVFGSFARGEATSQSDIDILYEVDENFIGNYRGFAAFSRLNDIKNELKKSFGRDVDIAANSGLSRTAKKYIKRDLLHV